MMHARRHDLYMRARWYAIAVTVAACASISTSLAIGASASATDSNYNCYSDGGTYPCYSAASEENYLTNDYAIDYTSDGVCGNTYQLSPFKLWKETCTSGYAVYDCNGNEYQIYGFGTTVSEGGEGNLAGTIDNYSYCG